MSSSYRSLAGAALPAARYPRAVAKACRGIGPTVGWAADATAADERRVLMTPEAAPEVRERLAALRLERDHSPPPRRRSRWPLIAGVVGLVLVAAVVRRG